METNQPNFIRFTNKGIYCVPGNFYLDPWKPVDYAIISHAHADHARWGMKHYLCHHYTKPVLQHRIGRDISVESIEFGETRLINGVKVSLHPAGHLIGSAQIRLEYKGEIVVFSGDYKVAEDELTTAFEAVQCHTFITESTFGLPIYNWKPNLKLKEEVLSWIRNNQQQNKTSILVGYSLGKAQRILKMIEDVDLIYTHSSIYRTNKAIETAGIQLPKTHQMNIHEKEKLQGNVVIVPPALVGSNMIKKIPNGVTAICSGWMQVRGKRRWKAVDAGFAISDHADWNGLLYAVKESRAEKIYVTHGSQAAFTRYLNEKGFDAEELITAYNEETTETD